MIPQELIKTLAAKVPRGQQMNFNHEGCPAGEDNKRRLYVRHTRDGVYVAYCHHCSDKGFLPGSPLPHLIIEGDSEEEEGRTEPFDWDKELSPVYDLDLWPAEARGWIGKYGIKQVEQKRYGLAFDASTRRVAIPMHLPDQPDEPPVGAQLRRIFGSPGPNPKYISVGLRCQFISLNYPESDQIVLVEDALSAIKVGRSHNAIALLGTQLSDKLLLRLAEAFAYAHIWLDPDDAGDKGASSLSKRLALYLGVRHVHQVFSLQQPKECNDETIQALLNDKAAFPA